MLAMSWLYASIGLTSAVSSAAAAESRGTVTYAVGGADGATAMTLAPTSAIPVVRWGRIPVAYIRIAFPEM